jgi:3-oxoacyl-[acyl-carrier protein] reductase
VNTGIEGRVAIVTGASRGIGYASAKALALEGVKVLMIARDSDVLSAAAEELKAAGGDVGILSGDVADASLPRRAVEVCLNSWGSLDILVNNAGGPPMGTFGEHDAEAWRQALETNLLSVVRFCKEAVAVMREQRWGRITSVSSTVAKEPTPAMVLSATARAGLSAFSKAVAVELAPFNVSVNVVCPGGVLTDRLIDLLNTRGEREGRAYDELLEEAQASIPAGRFASADEIAQLILFLSSEAAGYVTGVSLSIDGGLTKGYT